MINDSYNLVSLDINDIYLNLENPRFEKVNTQDEAMRIMITEFQYKIYNLAKHILENGINPTEYATVIKKDGVYVALDGNRRITTLKILKSPDLLNKDFESLKSKIMKLNRDNIPTTINAVEFTNEEEANIWINLKHTGENVGIGTVSWNSIQQSRFNNEKYPLSIQLLKYMESANLFNNSLSRIINDLKITNLERLLSDPDIRDMISVTRVKNQLHFPIPNNDIKDIFNNFLMELFEDDFTVNTIRNKPDRIQFKGYFIKKYGLTRNIIDELKKHDVTTANDYEALKQKENTSKETSEKPKGINDSKQDKTTRIINITEDDSGSSNKTVILEIESTKDRETLIPEDFNLTINKIKINDIYKELKKISVNDYPNVVGTSFRVFLELSIDYYIDENKDELNIRENDKLRNKLEKVKDHINKSLQLDKSIMKDINRAIASNNNIVSIDILHGYIHSTVSQASSDGLKTTWNNYEKFFELLYSILNKLSLAKA